MAIAINAIEDGEILESSASFVIQNGVDHKDRDNRSN